MDINDAVAKLAAALPTTTTPAAPATAAPPTTTTPAVPASAASGTFTNVGLGVKIAITGINALVSLVALLGVGGTVGKVASLASSIAVAMGDTIPDGSHPLFAAGELLCSLVHDAEATTHPTLASLAAHVGSILAGLDK